LLPFSPRRSCFSSHQNARCWKRLDEEILFGMFSQKNSKNDDDVRIKKIQNRNADYFFSVEFVS
jgi:hypothetical protein